MLMLASFETLTLHIRQISHTHMFFPLSPSEHTMPGFDIANRFETLLAAHAELLGPAPYMLLAHCFAFFPARKVTLLSRHDAARMDNVEEDEGDEHDG